MTTNAPADLELLTGEAAGELLAALLGEAGAELLSWRAGQVDHQPGGRTTVSYPARVRWADGAETAETFGATSASPANPLPDGLAMLSDGHSRIGMWRFPHDPDLPALSGVHGPQGARALATSVGLGDHPVRVRVRAYRPRRRAVLEITGATGSCYAKVVRPARARELHERHLLLHEAGCPVPEPLGWSADGLVVLAALPGRTLRAHLLADGSPDVAAGDVLALLDGLPAALTTGRRRATWGQRAPHYAALIAATRPELAARAHRVAAAADHRRPEGPAVAVHGDFYESQLLVHGGRVAGLLDVDTAGRGERLDDAACLLGHLAVLGRLHPGRAAPIERLVRGLDTLFARDLDRDALARRTAAVVLSLATGPQRVRAPGWQDATESRLALAESYLEESPNLSIPDSSVA